ncbi:RING/FYVE/PHD-type zinc finger family protein [Euphorbia peplus]|nr:RING/FYVE/PHD-type zinc finger family protein [Euphorbia peplus]
MSGDEGTSNGVTPTEGFHCVKHEAMDNGYGFKNLSDSGECSSHDAGIRTYKRRKCARSCSERKGQLQSDETIKEQLDALPKNHACLGGSNGEHKECRTFVLERICRSLNNNDGGGIQDCISDALKNKMEVQVSDTHAKDMETCPIQSRSIPNGTHTAVRDVVLTLNGSLGAGPVTKICQHAFRNIINSEKFTLLCKLLFENFQELKTDKILSLSPIHVKMKDGIYEQRPSLFHTDIQHMWKKLQNIGNELSSIAKSLSDVSLAYCDEQLCTTRESYLNGKSEEIDPCWTNSGFICRRCHGETDVRGSLVCDSCEEAYHMSCIEPAVNEIPLRNWYCGSCSAGGMDSLHENCAVCARLNAKGGYPAADNKVFEETSDFSRDNFCEASGGSGTIGCKICGSDVIVGEKVMICEHIDCFHKYYHKRCLTSNLLKSHGPRWYCPSCLCRVCLDDKDDDKIVLCDGCDHGYHMYCMNPPRFEVPRGKWFCVLCSVKIKKIHRAKREYEKQGSNLMKQEENMDNSREGMEILLTAALGHTSNSNT